MGWRREGVGCGTRSCQGVLVLQRERREEGGKKEGGGREREREVGREGGRERSGE